MKKLVFGLAMLASLSTFAISPVKNSSNKIKKVRVFDGEGLYRVRCGSLVAIFEACSAAEACVIGNRACPGCNVIEILRQPHMASQDE